MSDIIDFTEFPGVAIFEATYIHPVQMGTRYYWTAATGEMRYSDVFPIPSDTSGSLYVDPTAVATTAANKTAAEAARDAAAGYAGSVTIANSVLVDYQEERKYSKWPNRLTGFRDGTPATAIQVTGGGSVSWVTLPDSPYAAGVVPKQLRWAYTTGVLSQVIVTVDPDPASLVGRSGAVFGWFRKSDLQAIDPTNTGTPKFWLTIFFQTAAGASLGQVDSPTLTATQALTPGYTNSVVRTASSTSVTVKVTVAEVDADRCFIYASFSNSPATTGKLQCIVKLNNPAASGKLDIISLGLVYDHVQVSSRALYAENANELDPVGAIFTLQGQIGPLTTPITMYKVSNSDIYVLTRKPGSTTVNNCQRWVIQDGQNFVFQPHSFSQVLASTSFAGLPAAHYAAVLHGQGVVNLTSCDDAAPLGVNGMTVAGNHGHHNFIQVTTPAPHNKTAADVGSQWNDAGPNRWIIMKYVDATNLWIVRDYTRDSDGAYVVPTALTGTVLTHVSGATNTANITIASASVPGAYQLYPSVKNHTVTMLLNGTTDITTLANGGVYTGQFISVVDSYDVTSFASVIDYLKAHPGTAGTDLATPAGITAVLHRDVVHFIKDATSVRIRDTLTMVEAVRLGNSMITQSVPLNVTGSRTLWHYVPGSLTTGGKNYAAGANVTASKTQASFTAASRAYAGIPISRMGQVLMEADGVTPVIGFVHGADTSVDAGQPSARAALLGNAGNMDAEVRDITGKQYVYRGGGATPVVFAIGAQTVTSGFRTYFIPLGLGAGVVFFA